MKTIMVTAVGGEIANPVLKAIGKMKEPVRIVGVDVSPHSVGLYKVDKAYLIPRASDADGYRKRLLEIIGQESVDLLIPGSDTELPIISNMNDNGDLPCEAVIASNRAIMITRDKFESYKFFKEYDLPFVATARKEGLGELIKAYGYPIITKPASGSGSIGIKIILSKEELYEEETPEDYIFQELITLSSKDGISKSDLYYNGNPVQKDEISTQVYVSRDGRVLGIFSSKNNLKNGMPVFVNPEKMPKLETIIQDMAGRLANIGLRGPVNFQSKLTNDGFKVFEINMRFTGITGARSEIGYNGVEAAVKEYLYHADDATIKQSFQTDYSKCILRHYGDAVIDCEHIKMMEALVK